MLLNVRGDDHFQAYLGEAEQRLYAQMQPLLRAAINLQVSTNSVKAGDYIIARGEPMLRRHYIRVYRDQYKAVRDQAEGNSVAKAAGTSGVLTFLAQQLRALERRAGRQIRTIAQSLVEGVAQMILDMAGQGASSQKIARAIRELAPDLSARQAATIARTEIHASALEAVSAAIQDQEIAVRTKTWWANLDKRVRDDHRDAHEQVRPLDEPFEVGGELLRFPGDQSLGAGPGNVINCRCSVIYETADD